MKNFIKIIFVLGIVFISLLGNFKTHAYSDVKISLVPDKLEAVENEELTIQIRFSCDEDVNIAAFRMKFSFDSSKFVYKGLYSPYSTSDYKSHEITDHLTVLFVTRERGIDLSANTNVCLFELNFKATSDSTIGDSTFSAEVDGLCNYEDCITLPCAYIDPVNISKVNCEPANCNLLSLSAVDCMLSPQFSPDITNYIVNVPYSKSSIEFNANPEDPGAFVKVSRKTLNSSGKSTDIKITVTSPDKNYKKVYTVTVNRGTKDNDLSSKNKNSSKSSAKGSAKNSSSSKNKSANSLSENLSVSDSQNKTTLVVKENSFNFILFFVVSSVIVIILILILKKDHKVNK